MLTHPFTVFVLGALLVVAGLALRYIVGRNRFNRRGVGGLQQYSNYNRGLATTFFESILRLLGTLLIIGGFVLMLVYWYNQRTARQHRQKQKANHALSIHDSRLSESA